MWWYLTTAGTTITFGRLGNELRLRRRERHQRISDSLHIYATTIFSSNINRKTRGEDILEMGKGEEKRVYPSAALSSDTRPSFRPICFHHVKILDDCYD